MLKKRVLNPKAGNLLDRVGRAFFILFILTLCVSEVSLAVDIEELKNAAETETMDAKRGLIYKDIGDYYDEKRLYKEAGGFYVKAIVLSRERFSIDERLRLVTSMSWGGFFKEAIDELDLIVSEEPENLQARIQLARVLSWEGRRDDALVEVGEILKISPSNTEALVIKADVLRSKGDALNAIAVYEEILKKEGNFQARLSIAYAYLSIGKKIEARNILNLIEPKDPQEEKEFKRLKQTIADETLSDVRINVTSYRDSDHNANKGYLFNYGVWIDLWRVDLNYRLLEARDDIRNARARQLNATFDYKLGAYKLGDSGFGFGMGVSELVKHGEKEFLTWNLKANATVLKTSVGAHLSREVLLDTSRLIETEVRAVNAGFYVLQNMAVKFPIVFSFDYNDYSDDNTSQDMQLMAARSVYDLPQTKIGYRFRHLEFQKERGNGYFDPRWFVSHGGFITLRLERDGFYAEAEPSFGHQSFRRFGDETKDVFSVIAVRIGCKRNNLLLEVNWSAGDYAAGEVAGFRYSKAGVTANYRF